MTSDNSTAFEPLLARVDAMGGSRPADRISLRDHVVAVEIGAFQAERDVTQRVSFSVVVEVAPSAGAKTDDVDDILSYDTITEAIAVELAAERLNLLETLAERIADRILREPQPIRVFIRIEKLDRGPGKLGVEIVRDRAVAQALDAADIPAPLVVHLGNAAIASPWLGGFLDRCAADPRPIVLTVGAGDLAAPHTGEARSQRWVDLLGIEQNACVLSARDARLKVVATRTELDWGMKNAQLSIWAPTKMVMDAVDGPEALTDAALTTWLAKELGASETRIIDTADGLEVAL